MVTGLFQYKVHTVTVVIFKQYVNAVNVVHSTKIHFPPHDFFRRAETYSISPHTRCCDSINCRTSMIHVYATWRCV